MPRPRRTGRGIELGDGLLVVGAAALLADDGAELLLGRAALGRGRGALGLAAGRGRRLADVAHGQHLRRRGRAAHDDGARVEDRVLLLDGERVPEAAVHGDGVAVYRGLARADGDLAAVDDELAALELAERDLDGRELLADVADSPHTLGGLRRDVAVLVDGDVAVSGLVVDGDGDGADARGRDEAPVEDEQRRQSARALERAARGRERGLDRPVVRRLAERDEALEGRRGAADARGHDDDLDARVLLLLLGLGAEVLDLLLLGLDDVGRRRRFVLVVLRRRRRRLLLGLGLGRLGRRRRDFLGLGPRGQRLRARGDVLEERRGHRAPDRRRGQDLVLGLVLGVVVLEAEHGRVAGRERGHGRVVVVLVAADGRVAGRERRVVGVVFVVNLGALVVVVLVLGVLRVLELLLLDRREVEARDARVARADRRVVVVGVVVVRAVARAVEVVVLRVLHILEAALRFLGGEALGLLLLLAVADGLADRDHGLLEQLLLEILVVELGLEVDGVLGELVGLGGHGLGLGGGFAGGFDLFRGFDLGAFGVRHVDDRVERIDVRVWREF